MLSAPELNEQVMMYLSLKSLFSLRSVNTQLNNIFLNEAFWREKTCFDYGPTFKLKPTEKKYFEYYHDLVKTQYPQQQHAENAVAAGRKEELDWILAQNVLPTFKGANWAAKYGHFEMLKFLQSKLGILPDIIGANWAATENHIQIVKWLIQHEIWPDIYGYRLAEKCGHKDMIVFLNQCVAI